MEKQELQKALERFKNHVVSVSKRNLTNGGKNVSKKLYNSIKGDVKAMPNSFFLEFSMEDYGAFQDLGVKGKTSSAKAPDSPYKFGKGTGKKGGLTKGIKEWVQKRRFQFRDKKSGKFLSYESTAFLITRGIYNKGIRPSMFFTKPFEAAYKNLPEDLVQSFALDAEKLFNEQIDQIIKNGNN
jgi:hypothetical protein